MSFESFRTSIITLARKAGEKSRIEYINDTENGLYIARLHNGTKIICRPNNLQITATWGSGHMATATMNT